MSEPNQIATYDNSVGKFDNFSSMKEMQDLAATLIKSKILPDAYKTSEAVIAAEYLKNIGNSEEEHLQVLEDVKWAKANNQIVMGLVKFVQSKNWLAIREQRLNNFKADVWSPSVNIL